MVSPSPRTASQYLFQLPKDTGTGERVTSTWMSRREAPSLLYKLINSCLSWSTSLSCI